MEERVVAYDDPELGSETCWEPEAPGAALLTDDGGQGALALKAHPADVDQRCVVLRWDGVIYSMMGPSNDEDLHQRRLSAAGLSHIQWVGIVHHSTLVARLRPMWTDVGAGLRIQPLHYVVPLNERVVEVLAENLDVFRVEGSPPLAAGSSLHR